MSAFDFKINRLRTNEKTVYRKCLCSEIEQREGTAPHNRGLPLQTMLFLGKGTEGFHSKASDDPPERTARTCSILKESAPALF